MYQRILVPIDGSITSNRGLEEAIQLAKLTGAMLRLVHVADAQIVAMDSKPFGFHRAQITPRILEAGKQILKQGEARAQAAGIKVDSVLLTELAKPVSDSVLAQSEIWQAELIAIGTHGRQGIGRWLLGSDAEQIVRRASVPVLVVRAVVPTPEARCPEAVPVA